MIETTNTNTPAPTTSAPTTPTPTTAPTTPSDSGLRLIPQPYVSPDAGATQPTRQILFDKISQLDVVKGLGNGSGNGTATPTTPAAAPGTSTVESPAAPATPATPAAIPDLDSLLASVRLEDAPPAGTSPTQPGVNQPTTAPVTDPAATPNPATSTATPSTEEEPVPAEFTDAEREVIERYKNTETSKRFREFAKIGKALSREPEKGGLGYLPPPEEIIKNFTIADSLRQMVYDYNSGEPQKLGTWAQNWLYQMDAGQDGSLNVRIDPYTRQPLLKNTAPQALQAIAQNALYHPDAANALIESIPNALLAAQEANLPWAMEAANKLARPIVTSLVNYLQEVASTAKPDEGVILQNAKGEKVQIPAKAFLEQASRFISSQYKLTDDQGTVENPLVKQLQEENRTLRNRANPTSNPTQIQQQFLSSFKNAILTAVDTDVKTVLAPLEQLLTNNPGGADELAVLRQGLKQEILATLNNQQFLNAVNRYKLDVANGRNPNEALQLALTLGRQVYGNVAIQKARSIIQARYGVTAQNAARQPQPTATTATTPTMSTTPTGQPQAATPTAPAMTGRPVDPSQPHSTATAAGEEPKRNPHESLEAYTRRRMEWRFQTGQR